MRPPTRKSAAPMCEPSSAPSRLRAIRRKSAIVMARSGVSLQRRERDLRESGGQIEQGVGDGFLFDVFVFPRHLEPRAFAFQLDRNFELLGDPLVLCPQRFV